MSRPTPRPLVPVVLVLLLFAAVLSPTAAIGASWADRESAAFAGFWAAISAIWAEEGCDIDGNGGCRNRQAAPAKTDSRLVRANAGCIFDSDDRCRSGAAVKREAGCDIDGNGGCHP
jgi:hypothetical protein